MTDPPKDDDRRLTIADIKLVAASPEPDPSTQEELANLELQKRRAKLKGFQQDIDERKAYSKYFFSLACVWMLFVALMVFGQAHGTLFGAPFLLSEGVLVALIRGATYNILGLLTIVAAYLFWRSQR